MDTGQPCLAKSRMRILHVTPAFYPAYIYGGPIESVYQLCRHLGQASCDVLVLTTDANGSQAVLNVDTSREVEIEPGLSVRYCHRIFRHTVAPVLIRVLPQYLRQADVVHITSVYSFPTIPTLLMCRFFGKPVVWSPRGALQRWEGTTKPLAKRVWEWTCNALVSRKNCVLHVTSEQEAAESKIRLPHSDNSLIPNGVDIPEVLPPRSWRPEGKLRLLYLGRLHPQKGIENLLRALRVLEDNTISLVICGRGDDAYSLSYRELVHQLGLETCVSFQGHVDGKEKLNAFMHADVCVVPSYTENFGNVIAEALAHGVPVIASKGTPWSELEKRGCGLWVDNSPAALAQSITAIRGEKCEDMGKRGRAWMQKDRGWEAVARAMFSLYQDRIKQCAKE